MCVELISSECAHKKTENHWLTFETVYMKNYIWNENENEMSWIHEIKDNILSNRPRSCFLWVAALHVLHVRLVRLKCVFCFVLIKRNRLESTALKYNKNTHTFCCCNKVALNWANFFLFVWEFSFKGCTFVHLIIACQMRPTFSANCRINIAF